MALASKAPAIELRGTLGGLESLTVTPVPPPPRQRAFYWEVPNGVLPITAARASYEWDVGVILTGPGITESTQPVGVRIEGGRCRPGTVVVTPGTTLDLNNQDLVAHELYAVARGATERVVPAQVVTSRTRRQVQFAQAGVYEIRDVRQPSFRCWVIAGAGQGRVLLANAAGAFAATTLSDGDYTLKVYHEGQERAAQAVSVRGRDVQVQVSIGGGAAAPATNNPPPSERQRRR
jgi:plastocyanin